MEAELQRRGEGAAEKRGMGNINKRNAAANFENDFRNVGARPGGQAGAKAGASGVMEGEDVFARRKTRNVNYWDVSNSRGAGGAPAFVSGLTLCALYCTDLDLCRWPEQTHLSEFQ